MSVEVGKTCKNLKIILFKLYPNATYLIQPANVSLFMSLKVLWKQAVNDFRGRESDKILSKSDFASVFKNAFEQIAEKTIVNGFRACGLYPWNPDAIEYSKCLGKTNGGDNDNEIDSDSEDVVVSGPEVTVHHDSIETIEIER